MVAYRSAVSPWWRISSGYFFLSGHSSSSRYITQDDAYSSAPSDLIKVPSVLLCTYTCSSIVWSGRGSH